MWFSSFFADIEDVTPKQYKNYSLWSINLIISEKTFTWKYNITTHIDAHNILSEDFWNS